MIEIRKYKKIYIVGAPGSGKTTLARKLSKKLNYPNFETDCIKWNHSTKLRRPATERNNILNSILKNNNWIIDGAQYKDWTNKIWSNCDIVILCNPCVILRVFYILKRHFLSEEKSKKQMSLKNLFENIIFTIKFNKHYLPILVNKAHKYNKKMIDQKTLF